MKNEKPGVDGATCSVTGKRCTCGSSSGCDARRWGEAVDPLPKKMLRALRTVRLYIQASKEHLDEIIGDEYLMVREYPAPEMRHIRRKLTTAQAMIDEVVGNQKL